MKRIAAIILVSFHFLGCTDKPVGVVLSKSDSDFFNKPLPDCMCRYFYSYDGNEFTEFRDSCNKYDVLDTIK